MARKVATSLVLLHGCCCCCACIRKLIVVCVRVTSHKRSRGNLTKAKRTYRSVRCPRTLFSVNGTHTHTQRRNSFSPLTVTWMPPPLNRRVGVKCTPSLNTRKARKVHTMLESTAATRHHVPRIYICISHNPKLDAHVGWNRQSFAVTLLLLYLPKIRASFLPVTACLPGNMVERHASTNRISLD